MKPINKFQRSVSCFMVMAASTVVILLSGCGANEAILKSNRQSPSTVPTAGEAPAASINSVESAIEAMRTADFDHIFVLRRKDGGPMSADDKGFIRSMTADTNRRSISSDNRAVIIGSNYDLPDDSVSMLRERFEVEYLSKPGSHSPGEASPSNGNM